MLLRWFVLAGLLLAAVAVHAQTRYVSDNTVVELRRGPSLEFLIVRSLGAGEAVEVLEEDAENGYSRVRVLDQGTEGWILTRFLTAEPIARERLAVADRNLATARSRVGELEQEVASLTEQLNSTRQELEQIQASHGEVTTELAGIRTASANVVEIRDQNENLRQRLNDREQDVDRLTVENAALARRSSQNWFIVGAGVLFGGIVIGLIVPSLRRKRRSDW
ncbi:MAG TPA: TIGR04211 family SH3 domain-containing protein [Gammaproteobacteria bacterium]|nr:TIGR04211 family SH3 domain-containing protein [Gammaproteobacteria bacterium]